MSVWLAIGIGSKNSQGEWLEVYYPKNFINPSEQIRIKAKELIGYQEGNFTSSIPKELNEELIKISGSFSSLKEGRSEHKMGNPAEIASYILLIL